MVKYGMSFAAEALEKVAQSSRWLGAYDKPAKKVSIDPGKTPSLEQIKKRLANEPIRKKLRGTIPEKLQLAMN